MCSKLRLLPTCLGIIAVMAVMGLPGAAQSGSTSQSTPINTRQTGTVPAPTVAQMIGPSATEERLIRLEERVNLANERAENAYKLLQFVGVFAAMVLAFFSIRDVVLRKREGERQRGIDEIVMDMMKLQKSAAAQQVESGRVHLD